MKSDDRLSDERTPILRVQESVDNLYDFRDHYFERNAVEKASDKNAEVESEMKKTLQIFYQLQEEAEREDRAQFLMLKGRALNILPTFNQQVEDILSKAVKLNPKLSKAWNELGYSYWKKGDIPAAKNAFDGALRHRKCKVSLRSLSMVLRQLGSDGNEKMKNVHESLQKAKEAVELDVEDGISWYILGNAYLSLFFIANQLPSILKQCMVAYGRAQQDSIARSLPDLHFNMATAFRYDGRYQEALEAYDQTVALDPLWKEPRDKAQTTLDYLRELQNKIQQKGNLKLRRLQNILKSMKGHHVGPYGGGSSTSSPGKSIELNRKKLAELLPGPNREVVVVGKVVCCIPSPDSIPFTFCLVDDEKSCLAVNVYNMARGRGVVIGDSVAIPEPFVESVQVRYKSQEIDFNCVRVSSPVALVVNGHKLSVDLHIPPQVSVKCSSD